MSLFALLRLPASATDASDTNALPRPAYVNVQIHNPVALKTDEKLRSVTLYDIVAVSDAPDRHRIVASEREFHVGGYGRSLGSTPLLPHAMQAPRLGVFEEEEDDRDGFVDVSESALDNLFGDEWGWLAQDVDASRRSRDAEEALARNPMRDSLLMQSMKVDPYASHSGYDSMDPGGASPGYSTMDSAFPGLRAPNLLGRDIMRSNP